MKHACNSSTPLQSAHKVLGKHVHESLYSAAVNTAT